MCPPVSVRYGKDGVSYLYESWLYQLLYGDQMRLCFSCFKAAYLVSKETMGLEDWQEEEWEPESMELPEEGPQGQSGLENTGPEPIALASAQSDGLAVSIQPVPTELGPHDAVPLDLGPEDADPKQTLPWKRDGLSSCPHWDVPGLYWLDNFKASPPASLPILLALSPTLPVDIVEADTWLMDLKFVCVLDQLGDLCYITPLCTSWVVRTPLQRWEMLIRPISGEVILARLQDPLEQQDLHRWRLSVLDITELGVELVTIDNALQKGGFAVHSYSPWRSGTPEVWSSGPRGPGERRHVLDLIPFPEQSISPHN
uniref:Testis-expressed protein 19.2 n=1 Tax=Jaculus jaculus TaxID=51337 RepID=A0A8C5KE60_JACJA